MTDQKQKEEEKEYKKSTLDMEGFIFRQMYNYPLFTQEEENDTIQRMKYGETEEIRKQARDEMLLHNMRLVVSVAKRYRNLSPSLSFADLIQSGMIGLMTACERFEPELGNKFSTYAVNWIMQSITRELADKGRIIRFPVHVSECFMKIHRFITKYSVENAEELPDEKTIVDALGMDPWYVRLYMSSEMNPTSLDLKIKSDDDETDLSEVVADRNTVVEDDVVKDISSEQLTDYLKKILTKKQYFVIKERYGLEGGERKTLEEIGEEMGVTRERIRQIEVKALSIMRRPCHIQYFESMK